MANEVTVIFSGSSAETVACAKAFWLSIHPPPQPKSALVVTGINHRFPTASNTENGNTLKDITHVKKEIKREELNRSLERHLKDAEERKDKEEAEYLHNMKSFKREAQETMACRKAERLKKEELSRCTHSALIPDFSQSSEEDDEAIEAMAELDRFDEILKQKETL
ncbi:cilia- and flagella-associated protein HOATZ-like [Montipora capricornis]|uniref:cilia- and flagella-associated protein HOATZ-like n=1 Tax=Montipora capricornis TaxID=246305 RepID=UPI0035F18D77